MKQILTAGPGLLIGIPTLGRPVPLEWALTFKGLNPPINYSCNMHVPWGKPVAIAREEIAEAAVAQGHKYIFFLGDDVIPPPNALKQLIYRAEQMPEIGVVGGIYCAKCEPPAPLVFRGNGQGSYWGWKAGEFFECTGLGMDCTLIRVDVLKQMSKPWFRTVDEDQFDDGINQAEQWTEDLYFCKKMLEETNFKVYADASLICRHVDVYGNKVYSLPSNSLPMRRFEGVKSKTAIDIGSGPINREDQFPDYDLVRVDIRDECQPDYRCDVRKMPFESGTYDLVFSSHVLEHFGRHEELAVLKEWVRLVKPGGEIMLVLPNIEWAQQQEKKDNHVMNVLYGGQSYPEDFHLNGFWPAKIEGLLAKFGFVDISTELSGYNMITRATLKSKDTQHVETPRVRRVRTPRRRKAGVNSKR